MKFIILLLLLCLLPCTLNAQKVGLVLSGGGAKGISHIGVIQALEEHNIPIDYITGTSMGAIVGALYAIGYSPSEMMKLITSPDFMRWSKGDVEEEYGYFAYQQEQKPSLFSIRFSMDDSSKLKPALRNHLVSTYPMDMALISIFAPATAYSGGDFDKFFVPFRCVASDINNSKAHIFSKGDLGTAIRASMSYPGYFKPIMIDSTLLFDGGIYDNFPVKVMESDFKPDYIIGSTCAGFARNAGEDDIFQALENMVIRETSYSVPKDNGILISTQFKDISVMDFHKAKEIYRRGYEEAIAIIDSIRDKIPVRRPLDSITEARILYKTGLPPLKFRTVDVTEGNLTESQQKFVERALSDKEYDTLSYEKLKSKYFKLIGTGNVTTFYPTPVYDSLADVFDIHIRANKGHVAQVRVGGNIASSMANQGYFGFGLKHWGNYSTRANADLFIGRLYSSAQLSIRQDYPFKHPFYYEAWGGFSRWDFFNASNEMFFSDIGLHNRREEDLSIGGILGFPFLTNGSFKLGMTAGQLTTKTGQEIIKQETSGFEKYRFVYTTWNAGFEKKTFNRSQYPTRGRHQYIKLSYINGNDKAIKGPLDNEHPDRHKRIALPVVRFKQELYSDVGNSMALGSYIEGVWSPERDFLSYFSGIGLLPVFAPTPHSSTLFSEYYRSNVWLAAGLIPILEINDLLSLRAGGFLFHSFNRPYAAKDGRLLWDNSFARPIIMMMSAVTLHSPAGPISLSVNYYEKGPQKFAFLFNIGYMLYNRRGIN